MIIQEMYDKAKELYEELEFEYDVIGIRFEDKDREVGDAVENSKHNIDREDEREFPEYGTEEYEDLYELDGASSWGEHTWEDVILRGSKPEAEASREFPTYHAYLIGGGYSSEDHDEILLDQGEEVITNAKVLYKFF